MDAWTREYRLGIALGAALLLYAVTRTKRGEEATAVVADAAGAAGGAVVTQARNVAERLMPRGWRNNNPGNIRPGSNWRGLDNPPTDGQFLRFTEMAWGVRAIVLVLRSYSRRGVVTVRDIVTTWAPPVGRDTQGRQYTQNTDAYVRAVARRLSVAPDARLNVEAVMPQLVAAIGKHEMGLEIPDDALAEGLRRANA